MSTRQLATINTMDELMGNALILAPLVDEDGIMYGVLCLREDGTKFTLSSEFSSNGSLLDFKEVPRE